MASFRSMWKGNVRMGLVAFPVSLIKATEDKQGVRLNQLHAACGARIQERKFCPEHGELKTTDIVKGYESAPGVFVTLTDEEIEATQSESDHILDVGQVVPLGAVPFAKETRYLGTDAVGAPAYTLMRDGLAALKAMALTTISIRGREQLAGIHAQDNYLVLTTFAWPDEIRDPGELVPAIPKRPDAEIKMAKQLLNSMAGEYKPDEHKDTGTAALISLINDKIAGKPAPKAKAKAAPAKTPDLMAAIQASLQQQEKKRGKVA